MKSKIAVQLLLKKNLKLFQVGLFKNSPNPLSKLCNQLDIFLLLEIFKVNYKLFSKDRAHWPELIICILISVWEKLIFFLIAE